jgi:rifampicin phosphotransferase
MTAVVSDIRIGNEPDVESALLLPLADAGDAHTTGGKASTLARMCALRIPVPDGVVLTTRAFEAFLATPGLHHAIEAELALLDVGTDAAALEDCSRRVRRHVMSAPFPHVVDAALRMVAEMAFLRRPCHLAVRSSAVGEDGLTSSFAGQFDSVLNVDAASGLRDAVRTCWASYWSARAIFYRCTRRIASAGMAIVIQRQVDALAAGVLFTRHPQDNVDDMVAEYTAGLADRLVAGEVDPGRLQISRTTRTITRETAPPELAPGRAVLTADRVAELSRLALLIERAFAAPQDVEWAIGADGRVWIVQSRRITAPAASASRPPVLWSNANISENYPEPVSPLLYSIAASGYYHYFRNLGLVFGISRRRLTSMDAALRAIIGAHGARLYYNLTSIHSVLRMAPFGDRLAAAFNLFVGASDTAAQPQWAASWRDHGSRLRQAIELFRIAACVAWQFLFLGQRLRRFEQTADEYAERTTVEAIERRTLAELGADLAAFVDIRCHRWTNASLCDTAAMVCYALMRRCLARQGFGDATHTRLLRALPGVPSGEPALQLWSLSRLIEAQPELAILIRSREPKDVLETIDREPRLAAFKERLTDYLRSWGFRSSGELMLTVPTLEERPEPVIALLAQYIDTTGVSPREGIERQAAERRADTRIVITTLARREPLQALLVYPLLRCTQRSVACRERARLKQALLYSRCRRVALAIGERLVRDGRLVERDDVFMLTWQELDELCSGRALFPHSVTALVAARQAAHAIERETDPPDTFYLPESAAFDAIRASGGPEGPLLQERPAGVGVSLPDERALRGSTACGGRVSAPAAVLTGVHEARRLNRGDVLVTRQTDPGWAPVFCLVSGLVIERGGMLSHGAILAREFGLPCVVGVANATGLIPHGVMVTVDGDRGTCHVEGRP